MYASFIMDERKPNVKAFSTTVNDVTDRDVIDRDASVYDFLYDFLSGNAMYIFIAIMIALIASIAIFLALSSKSK